MYHIIELYHLTNLLIHQFVPSIILGPEDMVVNKTYNISSSPSKELTF